VWKLPASGASKNLWFPYNISATARAGDFKFGAQLGFAKAHHKITCRRKGRCGPGLQELSKIWGFPSIFTQWLKLATSNLAYSLDLPRPVIKSHPYKKWVWLLARGAAQTFEVLLQYLHNCWSLGLQIWYTAWVCKAHSKTTSRGKVGVALG